MNQKERKNKLDELNQQIEEKNSEMNVTHYVARQEDMNEIESSIESQYDYESEQQEIEEESTEIIDDLAKLYLGEDIAEHPYIKSKRKKDAEYYAKLNFLVKTSERSLVNMNREIDKGNATARMYEVLGQLQSQMRENIKLSSSNLTNIENFYKELREDMVVEKQEEDSDSSSENNINNLSSKEFNQKLEDMFKNKEKKDTLNGNKK